MAAKAKGEMDKIEQAVPCPVRGFEQVTITFNLLATPEQADNFIRRMGAADSHKGVVVKVEGWPKDEYGPDPWDIKRAPVIWTTWAAKKALTAAVDRYLNDPN